jgi:hypothetical protein
MLSGWQLIICRKAPRPIKPATCRNGGQGVISRAWDQSSGPDLQRTRLRRFASGDHRSNLADLTFKGRDRSANGSWSTPNPIPRRVRRFEIIGIVPHIKMRGYDDAVRRQRSSSRNQVGRSSFEHLRGSGN